MRALRICFAVAVGIAINACQSLSVRDTHGLVNVVPTKEKDSAPIRDVDVSETPDAVPRYEVRTSAGNTSPYKVSGKVYRVMKTPEGYKESGIASWYGRKFHGKKTANGDVYDMFAMTAAHKTLPIPSYVRVTNLENSRTVVVRVNDRGPFASGRIIDLSYAAAKKLGFDKAGTARVRVGYIPVPKPTLPRSDDTVSKNSSRALAYLQIGAFSDPILAVQFKTKIETQTRWPVILEATESGSEKQVHRILVGPFSTERALIGERDALVAKGLQTPLRVLRQP